MNSEIITAGVSIIIAIATTIITTISSKKKNNQTANANKKVEYAKIIQKLPDYIKEAEEIFGNGNGTAKKIFVLNTIQVDCLKANIEYLQENFEFEIEKILETPQKKEQGE